MPRLSALQCVHVNNTLFAPLCYDELSYDVEISPTEKSCGLNKN
ncbi:hypothetical protein Lalb_Chr16g0378011 [Lupinus albus]|uniref:Uncharacterized protein n=1 Tax=Lupinus albus TaxID=3870 RepID=A0A6A4NW96_LUPAL|nr:hypothetical protein Lalb_Chr16g0378011 [Lupinus albus]